MDIKGNVTISLNDYEKIKRKLNELDELKASIEKLFTKEFCHIDKTSVTIEESNIVDFIGGYLNIDSDPVDIKIEDYKIKVEWNTEDIPF